MTTTETEPSASGALPPRIAEPGSQRRFRISVSVLAEAIGRWSLAALVIYLCRSLGWGVAIPLGAAMLVMSLFITWLRPAERSELLHMVAGVLHMMLMALGILIFVVSRDTLVLARNPATLIVMMTVLLGVAFVMGCAFGPIRWSEFEHWTEAVHSDHFDRSSPSVGPSPIGWSRPTHVALGKIPGMTGFAFGNSADAGGALTRGAAGRRR